MWHVFSRSWLLSQLVDIFHFPMFDDKISFLFSATEVFLHEDIYKIKNTIVLIQHPID